MVGLKNERAKAKLIASAAAVLLGISLLVQASATAAVPTSGKWASRVQTMYTVSSASHTHWSNGAAKWRNHSNFKLSTATGAAGANYNYYSLDVSRSDVDWDGLCTRTLDNGFIVKAVLNLNKHYTSDSKYTSSILAGLTGHELGHSLGLQHASVAETSSIMHPYTFNSNGTPARALSPSSSDIAVVNSLYPVTKTAAPLSHSDAAAGSRVVHIEPSWAVYYGDEQALMKAADLVVKGKVSKEIGSTFAKGIYTDYNTEIKLQIADVLKGEKAPGEQITVSQMGGFDGDVKVVAKHSTHLQEQQEAILFLRQSSDGTYRPINEDDGIYLLEQGSYTNLGSGKTLNKKLIDAHN
ncbi:matrixin family metalloprotease [Paenibacillus montaniterrae]|nr:matrixin family metalloprotease [Paenibacillus montaniterrae]